MKMGKNEETVEVGKPIFAVLEALPRCLPHCHFLHAASHAASHGEEGSTCMLTRWVKCHVAQAVAAENLLPRMCHSAGRELLRVCPCANIGAPCACPCGIAAAAPRLALCQFVDTSHNCVPSSCGWSLQALIFASFIPTSLHVFQRPQIHSNPSFLALKISNHMR
ncbi:hypothetical protein HAX54_048552 [Datura stramonium]|uniref:Uncharacterized protein n=1 Tax=Datura stramonium TaxID=4076 RepID=A0ABS8WM76_DATST|nr:hypothetical protein [Datura stramonium]